jgi:hypothetical protein
MSALGPRHNSDSVPECRFLGVKRTLLAQPAYDPKRTCLFKNNRARRYTICAARLAVEAHRRLRRTHTMNYEAINFGKKFKLFDEQWQPKVIAEMNDYQFKIVKSGGFHLA